MDLGEYQNIASYVLYVVIACIVILIISTIVKEFDKFSKKKKINSLEKNVQLIYEELKLLNEKVDRIYYKDSDDFVEK